MSLLNTLFVILIGPFIALTTCPTFDRFISNVEAEITCEETVAVNVDESIATNSKHSKCFL